MLKSQQIAPQSLESRIIKINMHIAELINHFQLPVAITLSTRSAFGSFANPKIAAAMVIILKNEHYRFLSQSELKERICSLYGLSKSQINTAMFRWREKKSAQKRIVSSRSIPISAPEIHRATKVWRTTPSEKISVRRLVTLPALCKNTVHSLVIPPPYYYMRKNAILLLFQTPQSLPIRNHSGLWEFSPPVTTLHTLFGFDNLAIGPPRIWIYALEFG
jgi:hypothetical protein